jgi:hypothetical protein
VRYKTLRVLAYIHEISVSMQDFREQTGSAKMALYEHWTKQAVTFIQLLRSTDSINISSNVITIRILNTFNSKLRQNDTNPSHILKHVSLRYAQ